MDRTSNSITFSQLTCGRHCFGKSEMATLNPFTGRRVDRRTFYKPIARAFYNQRSRTLIMSASISSKRKFRSSTVINKAYCWNSSLCVAVLLKHGATLKGNVFTK